MTRNIVWRARWVWRILSLNAIGIFSLFSCKLGNKNKIIISRGQQVMQPFGPSFLSYVSPCPLPNILWLHELLFQITMPLPIYFMILMRKIQQHDSNAFSSSSITISNEQFSAIIHSLNMRTSSLNQSKPAYVLADQLVPFLDHLDICWEDVIKLLHHFTKIDEYVILHEAALQWKSLTLLADKFSLDHPTYNARVLAQLFFRSLQDDFCIPIIYSVPQECQQDSVIILWTICNNIHQNNILLKPS